MAKKKYKRNGMPILLGLGVIVAVAFGFLFGWMMLLRYLLGAIMFATVTLALIKFLNRKYGKKTIPWR